MKVAETDLSTAETSIFCNHGDTEGTEGIDPSAASAWFETNPETQTFSQEGMEMSSDALDYLQKVTKVAEPILSLHRTLRALRAFA
jgi:hypothetical protein